MPTDHSPTTSLSANETSLILDPSVFELDGTTYRDRSFSAAAQRAAYHRARTAMRLSGSAGNPSAPEQASNATFAIDRYDFFTDYGTAPGYSAQDGTQGPGEEGWIMHSQGGQESRLRFNLLFNVDNAPYTFIYALMRGAPDNGKNSYVTLIEPACAEEQQSGCDEIDIVEYYGQSSAQRAEWTFYARGQGRQGHGGYPTPTNAGHDAYGYSVYLERGNYIHFALWNGLPLGNPVAQSDAHASQQVQIPTQPMYLYTGIWDCTSRAGSEQWCVDTPPGDFTGDSWMALHTLGLQSWGYN